MPMEVQRLHDFPNCRYILFFISDRLSINFFLADFDVVCSLRKSHCCDLQYQHKSPSLRSILRVSIGHLAFSVLESLNLPSSEPSLTAKLLTCRPVYPLNLLKDPLAHTCRGLGSLSASLAKDATTNVIIHRFLRPRLSELLKHSRCKGHTIAN